MSHTPVGDHDVTAARNGRVTGDKDCSAIRFQCAGIAHIAVNPQRSVVACFEQAKVHDSVAAGIEGESPNGDIGVDNAAARVDKRQIQTTVADLAGTRNVVVIDKNVAVIVARRADDIVARARQDNIATAFQANLTIDYEVRIARADGDCTGVVDHSLQRQRRIIIDQHLAAGRDRQVIKGAVATGGLDQAVVARLKRAAKDRRVGKFDNGTGAVRRDRAAVIVDVAVEAQRAVAVRFDDAAVQNISVGEIDVGILTVGLNQSAGPPGRRGPVQHVPGDVEDAADSASIMPKFPPPSV